jgi:hypothetical protein
MAPGRFLLLAAHTPDGPRADRGSRHATVSPRKESRALVARKIDRRSAIGWILGLCSLRSERAVAQLPGSALVAAVAGGCRDPGAAATAAGEAVFDVREYGALGDGRHDDTPAFQRAITAAGQQRTGDPRVTASSGQGGVIFVPQGIYRVRETLSLPNGTSIRGAGMHTAQILFSMGSNRDGLVWADTDAGALGVGGFLEDIDVKAETYDDGRTARDLVVLSHWSGFAFNRARILGAGRYGLRIQDCVNISAFHLSARSAGTTNLWIGASAGALSTTCRFVSCYFQSSLRGPGVDVGGLGLTFDGCVFEDAGAGVPLRDAGEAYGIRVRGGTVTLMAPYFEANRSWELIAGTDAVPRDSASGASVTVINPVVMPLHDRQGSPVKVPRTGGFRFERGSAFIQGGNLSQVQRPLVFSTQMDLVQAAASIYPNAPEVEGGTLAQLPGTVLYKQPGSGQVVQAGNGIRAPNP